MNVMYSCTYYGHLSCISKDETAFENILSDARETVRRKSVKIILILKAAVRLILP
jgi:hypothetical protein